MVLPKLSQEARCKMGCLEMITCRSTQRPGASEPGTAVLPDRRMNPKRGKRNFWVFSFLKKPNQHTDSSICGSFLKEKLLSNEACDWLEAEHEATLYFCVNAILPFLSLWMKREGDWGVGGITRSWEGARQKPTMGTLQTGACVGMGIPDSILVACQAYEMRKQRQLCQCCLQKILLESSTGNHYRWMEDSRGTPLPETRDHEIRIWKFWTLAVLAF